MKTKIDDTDAMYNQPLLAPQISIDLIENAFKHADLQRADAFISIGFEFRRRTFYLTFSNKISTKASIKKNNSGIGIQTLEQRLKIISCEDFTRTSQLSFYWFSGLFQPILRH